LHPPYYRGCWHGVSRCLLKRYRQTRQYPVVLPSLQNFTLRSSVIVHAALLDQTFVHCPIFLTAASRRSLGRISVPVWLIILSDQLNIVGLVSHYLTNYLILRRPIHQRPKALILLPGDKSTSCGINPGFPGLFPTEGQVAYALLTRSPLSTKPKPSFPFDLHVLSTPPAFVLSQDQTLHCENENLIF
jgi:hypothetical protein